MTEETGGEVEFTAKESEGSEEQSRQTADTKQKAATSRCCSGLGQDMSSALYAAVTAALTRDGSFSLIRADLPLRSRR